MQDDIEALCKAESKPGCSPGATARQMCRSLPQGSAVRTMLEALLADANRAAFDRSVILREFDDAAPAAAAATRDASFQRINEPR